MWIKLLKRMLRIKSPSRDFIDGFIDKQQGGRMYTPEELERIADGVKRYQQEQQRAIDFTNPGQRYDFHHIDDISVRIHDNPTEEERKIIQAFLNLGDRIVLMFPRVRTEKPDVPGDGIGQPQGIMGGK